MKLVHKPLTRWIPVLCAIITLLAGASGLTQEPEYLRHFDPSRGFKPAQTNLTNIFLQIAGSLEATGNPESYLRHMQAEHIRISSLYEAKTGKRHNSRMPSHMTGEYIDRYVRNWTTLSTALQLDAFAKNIGRYVREGVMGTRMSGTLAVKILNEHQAQVTAMMNGDSAAPAGFVELRTRLEHDLEFGNDHIDMAGYDSARRDAVSYAYVVDGAFRSLFKRIDQATKPEKAGQIKKATVGAFLDLGHLAQSELEIGILESALTRL